MFDAIAQNWGADGPGRLYGQDVSKMGVQWTGEGESGGIDPRVGMNTSMMGAGANGEDVYKALGFNEPVMIQPPYDTNVGSGEQSGQLVVNPNFTAWLKQKGYTPVSRSDESGQHGALQDANGNIVAGSERQWGDGGDDAFGIATLLAGGVVGAAAAGAGAAGAGAGLAGQEGLQSGIGAAGGFGQSAAGAGAAGTYDVAYNPYNGPGSTGYQVAGDNAVAPGAMQSGAGFAGQEGMQTGIGAAGGFGQTTAGGGFMSQAGNALGDVGSWMTKNPGLVNIGGTVANGLIGAYTANNALNKQTDATNQANALWAPYRELGTNAVGKLNALTQNPGSITSDPGYAFGLSQGVKGVDNSAASRGNLYSGATLKALNRYGTNYGTSKLNDAYSRYSGLAQLGATGTTNTAKNTMDLGESGAGASLITGRIWNNALNGSLGQFNQSTYMKKPGD